MKSSGDRLSDGLKESTGMEVGIVIYLVIKKMNKDDKLHIKKRPDSI
jgi:hypothetical protein